MTTHLGVPSISLLLLALAVRESLATPLTVFGLMGLVFLRLSLTSGGWAKRRRRREPSLAWKAQTSTWRPQRLRSASWQRVRPYT